MTTFRSNHARFHMMAKPASYRCNLKCDYCFYLEKEQMMQPGETAKQAAADQMSDAMLKRYVRDYIRSQDSDMVDFAWQGGEPTLAGLDFYRNAVKYQKQYAEGKTITNSFQTNAVAINRQWAQFFAEHNFLIGVSVDGAAEVHDKYRISVNGKPTFERVKHAIELLKEYQVQFNTLTVINDQNWNKGKETYHALKALGSEHLQFIPIVEIEPHCQQSTTGHYSPAADATLTPFSVPANGYGRFMTDVFNEWVARDVGQIYVRMFDSILATWMGYPASVCVQSKNCGQAMVIEANGDVYSCDHYVYPANKLGNISQTNIAKLAQSKQQLRFGQAKSTRLTEQCKQCSVQALCYGGCPKHRIVSLPGEKHRQNYLCQSYQQIFKHTAPAMHHMVQAIQRGGIAADVMPAMSTIYNNDKTQL
ncbi:anaerobic sulfatase maturase [Photobacterium gaetbulicola]|uniref:Putative arylsulfatase regulator n=1 Tax=Photobacterium gaetbulicola Gung47 TaxID=658445 RepID=A0A0C5WA56_9GAMM|nr:anaerobic sulfatase maturase [Photobacterium gaetbulicola]AJR08456.1 putative arylsulfatase regulator [Photobacterium gaetbulicola Gung47]PSU12040.1 anaerobic sulfatase maturase [Photobacterium gaetbulicola]